MYIDNPFTPEEVSKIRKRIMEAPLPGQDAEREFYLFFEHLRIAAELYSCLMFRTARIIDFDPERDRVCIRDKEGNKLEVNLSYPHKP